jgi:hypothetical protein
MHHQCPSNDQGNPNAKKRAEKTGMTFSLFGLRHLAFLGHWRGIGGAFVIFQLPQLARIDI